ncbi:Fructose-2,6-bisphosphatase, partial [Borealophlyctis nickersoniae]
MVGLPARGKTFIARKTARYLSWLGHHSKIFNVGNYRREVVGANVSNDFFDPRNPEGAKVREKVAEAALMDMCRWFEEAYGGVEAAASASANGSASTTRAGGGGPSNYSGYVAFYDATNSTVERRKVVYDTLTKRGIEVMFIESICDDEDMIMNNIKE